MIRKTLKKSTASTVVKKLLSLKDFHNGHAPAITERVFVLLISQK